MTLSPCLITMNGEAGCTAYSGFTTSTTAIDHLTKSQVLRRELKKRRFTCSELSVLWPVLTGAFHLNYSHVL